jgi:hypothetical protein
MASDRSGLPARPERSDRQRVPRRRGFPALRRGRPMFRGVAFRRSRPPSTRCARWRQPDAVEEIRVCSGDPVISPSWRRALPVCHPSGSPLGLRSLVGSSRVREYSPRRDSHAPGRPSRGKPCELPRSLPPTLSSARSPMANRMAGESETSVSLSPRARVRLSLYPCLHAGSIGDFTHRGGALLRGRERPQPGLRSKRVGARLRSAARSPGGASRLRSTFTRIAISLHCGNWIEIGSRAYDTCPEPGRSTVIRKRDRGRRSGRLGVGWHAASFSAMEQI